MSIGFLLYDEGYVWTKRGLLHLYELRNTDEILGDKNGTSTWVSFNGLKKISERHNAINIFSDTNELSLPSKSIISTHNGYKRIDNLTEKDNIYIYSNKDLYTNYKLINKKYENFVYYKKNIEIEVKVTPIVSYIFGRYLYYDNSNVKRITIRFSEPSHVQKVYYDFLHSFELSKNDITCFINWVTNELIIKSDIFETIYDQFTEYPRIPLIMRESPLDVIQAFILGLFENKERFLRKRGDKHIFRTRDDECSLRNYVLNHLFLFGIRPYKTSIKKLIDMNRIDISLLSSDISNLNKKNILVDSTFSNLTLDDVYPDIVEIQKDKKNSYYLLVYPQNITNFRLIYNSSLITPIKI